MFDSKGQWINDFSECLSNLKPFKGPSEYFNKGRADLLIKCMENGNARILEWILEKERQLPSMSNEHLYGVALAANSGNDHFINYVVDGKSPVIRMSADKITVVKDLFLNGSDELIEKIEGNPAMLHGLSAEDIRVAWKYNTLNPDMLRYALIHEEKLDNWQPEKLNKTREAFDLGQPRLTQYILAGDQTWENMSEREMEQTIRAFRAGNHSLIKKIVRNKEGKQWHRLGADVMREKNNMIENGSALNRFKARRGVW